MPRPKLPATLAAEHEKQAIENDFSAATCTNAAAAAMLMQRATFHATMAVLYHLRAQQQPEVRHVRIEGSPITVPLTDARDSRAS